MIEIKDYVTKPHTCSNATGGKHCDICFDLISTTSGRCEDFPCDYACHRRGKCDHE